MAGALGRMFAELRQLQFKKQTMKSITAEEVASSHIQKDKWENKVIMQLTTPKGIPYTFAFDPKFAAEIADHLKTASARNEKPGNA